ncbi:hypothetical protein DOY81_009287, partial [Sarcophaga bullata]
TTGQPLPPQASRELEKLRRELMYRNQLSLQQDARLHLQREALQQRQAELRSVDQRIYELQTRLQHHAHVKLNLTHTNANTNHLSATNPNTSPNFFTAESDESKLAKKMLTAAITNKNSLHEQNQNQTHGGSEPPAPKVDTSHHIYAEVGPKKRDLVKEVAANLEHQSSTNNTNIAPQSTTSKIPKSISSNTSASALINKLNTVATTGSSHIPQREKSDLEKKPEIAVTSETLMEKNAHQLTVHSMPVEL